MSMKSFSCILAAVVLSVIPALSLAQDEVADHVNKGAKLYKEGKLPESINEFLAAKTLSPKDARIYNWIGFVYLVQEKYAEAVEPLEQAAKLDPKYPEAYTNLG